MINHSSQLQSILASMEDKGQHEFQENLGQFMM